MKAIIDYQRGEDKGAILINGEHSFIAVTIATSKTFKSFKGAEKYMDKYNYKKANKNMQQ